MIFTISLRKLKRLNIASQWLDYELEPATCIQKRMDMRICPERKDHVLCVGVELRTKHFLFKCDKLEEIRRAVFNELYSLTNDSFKVKPFSFQV